MKLSIRIQSNRLPAIAKLLPEAADALVNGKHGPAMEQTAKSLSRVDTGAMRDGWRWEATGQGEGQLTNDVPYTIWNEYGTHKMAAQPMARPALERQRPEIIADFQRLENLLS